MEQEEVDEPFRKQKTRPFSLENLKDHIFSITKEMISKQLSKKLPTMNKLELKKLEKIKPLSLFDKIIQSDHKINSKKIQIIKLPKLPFGKHENYNSESLFVTNHFIPSVDTEKTREIDSVVKKYRLFEKQYQKSKQNSKDFKEKKLRKNNNIIYKTNAGLLVCKRNNQLSNIYEQYSSRYRNSIEGYNNDSFNSDDCSKKNVGKNSKVSVSNIIKRLYPTPEPSTNKILTNLFPKYMILFSDNK